MRRAPLRPLSPVLLRRAVASHINQKMLASAAGFPDYASYYTTLRSEKVIATPLRMARLMELARILDFPADEIFLDEPLVKKRETETAANAVSQ